MRVLIIEDDRPTLLLLKRLMEERGYEVEAEPTAEWGLRRLATEFFPLVFLDINLPGLSGLDVCRQLRAQPDGDRFFVLVGTSRSTPEDLTAILEAGASDYLAKPYRADLLNIRLRVAEARIRDIERRQVLEAELRKLATSDPLTGLYNRREFDAQVIRLRGQSDRLWLCYSDLDRFKEINDKLGHAVGDQFLQQVADVLRGALPVPHAIFRFGGDEIVMLTADTPVESIEASLGLIQEEVKELARPLFEVEPLPSISFGLASFENGQDCWEALRAADEACYRAKKSGGASVVRA